jgi:hypothetical protein
MKHTLRPRSSNEQGSDGRVDHVGKARQVDRTFGDFANARQNFYGFPSQGNILCNSSSLSRN